ncbi:hypothetical protein [Pelagicoccus mobilis]|uniref:Uncharacterized protein n=1 Tax=Pelagicoccus mobilis TaxID=415221 RepID=A0A934VU02_9BACT|nr:hypothetical protein [Pelagicoccus mobilis]MBK1880253.1 hypothetical protein [Pelagicoccus mobilis]
MNPEIEAPSGVPLVEGPKTVVETPRAECEAVQDAIVIYGWYWLLMEELDLMKKRLGDF